MGYLTVASQRMILRCLLDVRGMRVVGDDEESADLARMYARCKPVAPVTRSVALLAVAGQEAADAAADADADPNTLRIFYGNDTYYVFFRLHQYLYDRYAQPARNASNSPSTKPPAFADGINTAIIPACSTLWGCSRPNVRRLRVAHTCALRKPAFQQTGALGSKGASAEEYGRIHGQFMKMVHDLIEGALESSAYEDSCRALLGKISPHVTHVSHILAIATY